jgi:hypothetical protein
MTITGIITFVTVSGNETHILVVQAHATSWLWRVHTVYDVAARMTIQTVRVRFIVYIH